jgi:hypothetical protein
MTKQALKIALAALGNSWTEPGTLQYEIEQEAITAIKEAIAELESQEPFCYVYKENGEDFFAPKDGYYPADAKPLYTHPPQRTWVGLTDEEIEDLYFDKFSMGELKAFAKAIEAKLKEKNT